MSDKKILALVYRLTIAAKIMASTNIKQSRELARERAHGYALELSDALVGAGKVSGRCES